MTAFSRSHLLMLGFAVIAPVTVAIACASEPEAPGDGADDGDSCTNTQTDVFNCGTCGHVCAMGQFCQSGQCACTPPYGACGNSCLNLQGDAMNCGTCGNVCPASASFCSNGSCSATCSGTQCNGICTNTASDILNCGACGTTCPANATCSGGACACPAGTVLCGNACMASCGGGGTGGTTGGTAGALTGGSAGSTPTGGSAGSGQGGSGGMVVQKLCATKVVPATATLTDFESYDGTKPAYGSGSWTFTIGPTATPAYAGLYALSERTAGETPPPDYMLTMAAGANASNWAARAVNMTTTDWGGGIGMWMGCVNASTFTGITFQVRGSGPLATARISLAMEDATPPDAANPAAGGTCDPAPADGCASPTAEFPITVDWTPVTIPWAMFMPGRGAGGVAVTATGDEITGISFGVNISYVPNPVDGGMPAYVPEPGAFEIAVDNIAFAQ
jgi:hypothetical protein